MLELISKETEGRETTYKFRGYTKTGKEFNTELAVICTGKSKNIQYADADEVQEATAFSTAYCEFAEFIVGELKEQEATYNA